MKKEFFSGFPEGVKPGYLGRGVINVREYYKREKGQSALGRGGGTKNSCRNLKSGNGEALCFTWVRLKVQGGKVRLGG